MFKKNNEYSLTVEQAYAIMKQIFPDEEPYRDLVTDEGSFYTFAMVPEQKKYADPGFGIPVLAAIEKKNGFVFGYNMLLNDYAPFKFPNSKSVKILSRKEFGEIKKDMIAGPVINLKEI